MLLQVDAELWSLQEARVGLTSNYYTFPNTAGSIPVIWANGNSLSYGYHGGNRGNTIITLSEPCPLWQ